MSDRDFTQQNPLTTGKGNLRCEAWERLLPEAFDGTLSRELSAAFEEHARQCAVCARMLEEARQGTGWLDFLKTEPETPAGLLEKILLRTRKPAQQTPAPRELAAKPSPLAGAMALVSSQRAPAAHSLWTAAMAFFSIALTLNLIGVKFSEVHLSDLRPEVLLSNLTRQYYAADAQFVRYYENLRLFYEIETTVRDLERSAVESSPQTSPSPSSRNRGGDVSGKPGSYSGGNPELCRNPEASVPGAKFSGRSRV